MWLVTRLLVLSVCSCPLVSAQQLRTIPLNLTMLEEQPRGSMVGRISIVSEAVPPYTIYHADPQDGEMIRVSSDGFVTVGGRVDREQKSLYRLIAHSSNNVNVEVQYIFYSTNLWTY